MFRIISNIVTEAAEVRNAPPGSAIVQTIDELMTVCLRRFGHAGCLWGSPIKQVVRDVIGSGPESAVRALRFDGKSKGCICLAVAGCGVPVRSGSSPGQLKLGLMAMPNTRLHG